MDCLSWDKRWGLDVKDVTEVNGADGKKACRRIAHILENLTVRTWATSTQVDKSLSVLVLTSMWTSCNMHLFDDDDFWLTEVEMLIAEPCITKIIILSTDNLLCLIQGFAYIKTCFS